jgi:hypothetical protein
MTLRSIQVGVAAVIVALAAISLAGASARAFTIETLGGGSSDGSSRFADPDDQVKNLGPRTQPFGQNGPTVQFGQGQGPLVHPFGGFGRPDAPPPMPYTNGNNY